MPILLVIIEVIGVINTNNVDHSWTINICLHFCLLSWNININCDKKLCFSWHDSNYKVTAVNVLTIFLITRGLNLFRPPLTYTYSWREHRKLYLYPCTFSGATSVNAEHLLQILNLIGFFLEKSCISFNMEAHDFTSEYKERLITWSSSADQFRLQNS
jgi:hypothetical protein